MIQTDDFAYELLNAGGPFTMLKIALPHGKSIKAESGAMVAMDDAIQVEGKKEGSLLGGLARKLLTNESFFFQTLTASGGAGEVLLSPGILGDITAIELDGTTEYQLQKGGFFAASSGVEISTKMQNLAKGLLSGEGFMVQQVSGKGTLFVESFGAIHELVVPAGKSAVVDNFHLVAWDSKAGYTLEKAASGWISSITSGEGLVCRFTGPVKVYLQTRNPVSFTDWLSGRIKTK
ncbi:MAG: TIGR00266 family protein [Planctomycetes bacterium]|nr:TIGR00266 family protein [Planctomycetota bacterium]